MSKDYTAFLLTELKTFIKRAGSQKAAAQELGIANSYVCDMLAERKPVSDTVAERLGFRWKLERVRQ
jgi:hypothetical protein